VATFFIPVDQGMVATRGPKGHCQQAVLTEPMRTMGARAAMGGMLPVVKEAGGTPGTTELVVAVQTAAGRMQIAGRAPGQVGEQEGQATLMLAAVVAAEVATTSPMRGDPRLAAAVVVTQAAVVEDPVPATALEVAQVVEVVAPRGLVPAIFRAPRGSSRFQAGFITVKEGRVAQDAQVLTVPATRLRRVEQTTDI